jgi:subtilisin family serine protease
LKRIQSKVLSIIIFLFLFINSYASAEDNAAADHIIVKYRTQNTAYRSSSKYGTVTEKFRRTGLSVLKLSKGKTVNQTLAVLRNDPSVLYAEPDYIIKIDSIPDDTYYGDLWGVTRISAAEAWQYTMGSKSVVVAVIDTGVDYTHHDLTSNIWTNADEIPGNGIDDDHNGYIDDIHGYDFRNNDSDPFDDHGHGTHCAGTVGGVGFNSLGIIGVSPIVTIMPVKFLAADGTGSTSGAIRAIEYAVANGAKILSCSWGGGEYSTALLEAINMADSYGVTVIAAAGNNKVNTDVTPQFPSCYQTSNIISVGASTEDELPANFSNFGLLSVDLFAPGQFILSTYPGQLYRRFSGTSMATPHVSGTLALYLSSAEGITPAALRQSLINTSDKITAYSGLCVSGGRMNTGEMVISSNPSPYLDITSVTVTGGDGDSFPESGETVSLNIEIINKGEVLRDSTSTLYAMNNDVEVITSVSTYPDTLTGGRALNLKPYTIKINNISNIYKKSGLILEVISRFTGKKERIEVPLFIGNQCDILLVDDDGGSITETYIAESLKSLGYNFVIWDVQKRGMPALSSINPALTIWNTGNLQGQVLTGVELNAIKSFLTSGGAVCMTGDEWANVLADDSFLKDIMKAGVLNRDISPEMQIGINGFTGLNFQFPVIAVNRDRLYTFAGGSLLSHDTSSSTSGSISIAHTSITNGPITGAAFDISTLPLSDRNGVLDRIIKLLRRPEITSVTPFDRAFELSLRLPSGIISSEIKVKDQYGTENITETGGYSTVISGLSNGGTYSVSARSIYAGGVRSEWSTELYIVPAADGESPLQAVNGLFSTSDGEGVLFVWQKSADTRVVSYNIEVTNRNGRVGFFTSSEPVFRLNSEYINSSDGGTISVYPLDSNGNPGSPANYIWEFNDVYPPVDVTDITATRIDFNTISVTWRKSASSDLKRYLAEIQTGSQGLTSPADTGTETTILFKNVPDGVQSFINIKCEDNAGNVSQGSIVYWGKDGRGDKSRLFSCGCGSDQNESDDYEEAGFMAVSLSHLCNLLLTGFGIIITTIRNYIQKRKLSI